MRGYARFVLIGLLVLGLFCGSALGAPSITGFSPGSTPSSTTGDTLVFSVNINETSDVTWYIDGSSVATNTSVTFDVYSNNTAPAGTYNVTAVVENGNGTDQNEWTWTVNNPALIVTLASPAASISDSAGDSRTFTATANQVADITWILDDITLNTNTSIQTASYYNASAQVGIHNLTAIAENANGTDQKEWTWTVNNPALSVTLTSPAASVSDNTGDSRTFTAASDQSANITWILDGVTLFTNTSAQTASYYNSSAQIGMHNLTVFAENGNGTDQKEWAWNVSNAPAPTITLSSPSSSSVDDNTGASRTFTVNVGQVANLTWILDGTTLFTNTSIQTASYYNASAQVGVHNLTVFAENVNGTDQKKWDWNVTNESLSVTGSNPTTPVDSIESVSQEFNVTMNQDSIVKWYIDGGLVQTNTSAKIASYVNTTSSIGSYNITAIATNANGTDQEEWTWDVRSKTFYTGDRIWDELTSPSLVYTWTAMSYSGFYYDLDSGEGSESMEITLSSGSTSVGSGKLKYSTAPISTNFERTAWGKYEVIGFMAENYFAGYKAADTIITDTTVSVISNGQLSKVLMNEDEQHSAYAGSALILEDGYTLNVVEVDRNGDKVFVTLTKDGSEMDSTIISSNDDYVYEKDIGSADDVPMIIVHFEDIFQGIETSAVFVEGIFQISDEYITVRNGDTFGKMEITTVDATKIEMENDNSFSLSRDNTIDIMGKIKFNVADSNDIRFAPFVDMTDPGTYELRGTVAENEDFKWTPLNFEGFFYDIDDGVGTESLEATISGTTISADGLVYKAEPKPVRFEYGLWNTYEVVGFMAENYFAGYPSTTTFSDSVSMISNGQLSKVLINEGDKSRAIHSGAGIILDEGYVLNIVEVDKNGDRVLVSLSKDGKEVEGLTVVSSDDTYVYEKDLGSSDDVPIIAVHFDQIFQGAETNAVFVDGIFQISDEYITVEVGDTFGKMEVKTVDSNNIVMMNDNSISLSKGKSVSIMGDILFKVADDSDDVRYYPYVEISTAPSESLDISMPTSVLQGEYVSIIVTSRGATVGDVTVKFDDDNVGKTSNDGTLTYKPALSGTYTVTVEKDAYVSASGQVEVISPLDETKKMSIEVSPDVVHEGNQLIISTIKAIGGEAIEGVDVSYDGKSLGTTSSGGTISYTVKEPGMHKLTATKTGFLDAEFNLEVLALEAKFEFSNLVVSPLEVKMGKDVTITLNASNTGKAAGDYNVDLMVNGNLTESKTITLDVGESLPIEFTIVKDEPGTYLVDVNGLAGTFEVLEKASAGTATYVIGILGIFAAAAIGYMFTAGGWTVEMVTAKVAEFIESVR